MELNHLESSSDFTGMGKRLLWWSPLERPSNHPAQADWPFYSYVYWRFPYKSPDIRARFGPVSVPKALWDQNRSVAGYLYTKESAKKSRLHLYRKYLMAGFSQPKKATKGLFSVVSFLLRKLCLRLFSSGWAQRKENLNFWCWQISRLRVKIPDARQGTIKFSCWDFAHVVRSSWKEFGSCVRSRKNIGYLLYYNFYVQWILHTMNIS